MLTNSDFKFVVESEPKVIIKNAITFTCYGDKVGSIDAEYDFSKVPFGLHSVKTIYK